PDVPGDYQVRLTVQDSRQGCTFSTQDTVEVTVTVTELRNGPNPASTSTDFFYDFDASEVSEAKLMVFNVAGRLVYSATLPLPATGPFRWFLTDNQGRDLASGLYLYVILADGAPSVTAHRLVIER
ncbi:MAG: hypothetical protein ACE5JP_12115, partial [Candidatus Bipolaricaulia bacterium]